MGYPEDRGPNPFEDDDPAEAEPGEDGLEGLLDLLDVLLQKKEE
jgi:hypothetical protein